MVAQFTPKAPQSASGPKLTPPRKQAEIQSCHIVSFHPVFCPGATSGQRRRLHQSLRRIALSKGVTTSLSEGHVYALFCPTTSTHCLSQELSCWFNQQALLIGSVKASPPISVEDILSGQFDLTEPFSTSTSPATAALRNFAKLRLMNITLLLMAEAYERGLIEGAPQGGYRSMRYLASPRCGIRHLHPVEPKSR
jgi:hypothetical protein